MLVVWRNNGRLTRVMGIFKNSFLGERILLRVKMRYFVRNYRRTFKVALKARQRRGERVLWGL